MDQSEYSFTRQEISFGFEERKLFITENALTPNYTLSLSEAMLGATVKVSEDNEQRLQLISTERITPTR